MFDLSLVTAYSSTTRALDSVPRTQVALPRWTAIDRRCRRNEVARLSYVMAVIRRPIIIIIVIIIITWSNNKIDSFWMVDDLEGPMLSAIPHIFHTLYYWTDVVIAYH